MDRAQTINIIWVLMVLAVLLAAWSLWQGQDDGRGRVYRRLRAFALVLSGALIPVAVLLAASLRPEPPVIILTATSPPTATLPATITPTETQTATILPTFTLGPTSTPFPTSTITNTPLPVTPSITPTRRPQQPDLPPPTQAPPQPDVEITTQQFDVYFCEHLGNDVFEWQQVEVTYHDATPVAETIVDGPFTGPWQPGCPAGEDGPSESPTPLPPPTEEVPPPENGDGG